MKIIYAKFNSLCAETGCKIKKGERMVYDYVNRKAYAIGSNKAVAFINGTPDEPDGAAGMVQANENAFFDNFCQNNGI